jgi:hypothetical protein
MKVVGDLKMPDKDVNKMCVAYSCFFVPRFISHQSAAFYCVGELMAMFGAQVCGPLVLLIPADTFPSSVHVLHG